VRRGAMATIMDQLLPREIFLATTELKNVRFLISDDAWPICDHEVIM
jgi:hypothetical protein